jgi:hypothetical protein
MRNSSLRLANYATKFSGVRRHLWLEMAGLQALSIAVVIETKADFKRHLRALLQPSTTVSENVDDCCSVFSRLKRCMSTRECCSSEIPGMRYADGMQIPEKSESTPDTDANPVS